MELSDEGNESDVSSTDYFSKEYFDLGAQAEVVS